MLRWIEMRKLTAALLCAVALFAADPVRRAPGFCLSDTTGQWRDLADYQGKPVILEFMQTTCPHCAAFTTILAGIRQKYGDRVAILAVALTPDTPATMLQYVAAHKLTYPLLLDQGQMTASYVRAPSLEFPTIYLIDAKGMIRSHYEYGPINKEIFEGAGLAREIDKMLAPAPAPPPGKK